MKPRSLRWGFIAAGCLFISCALAGETGMSETGTVNPGPPPPMNSGPPPRIAPPGGGVTPAPLPTNTTPAVGSAPLPVGAPAREVQPGVETPQVDNPSGQGLGGRPRAGTRSSGDEDDIDDLEIERHTVRGVDMPGPPSKPPSAMQRSGGDGTQTEDDLYVGRKATDTPLGDLKPTSIPALPSSAGVQRSGGDGTQTEDDLYVGRKATDGPLDASKPSPAAALSASSPQLPQRTESMATPARPALPRAVVVVPRQSCGTYWTGWLKDPNADANPCPKGCQRGKQLQLNQHKNGDTTEYEANYECYLPELSLSQPASSALVSGAAARKNCGTMWTGWQSDPNSAVNPCPANCERGELRRVNRGLSNGKPVYDMNYRCYVKEAEAAK